MNEDTDVAVIRTYMNMYDCMRVHIYIYVCTYVYTCTHGHIATLKAAWSLFGLHFGPGW